METSADRKHGDDTPTSKPVTNTNMRVVPDKIRDKKTVYADLLTTSDYSVSFTLIDELQGLFFEQLDKEPNEKTMATKLLFNNLSFQYKMRELRFLPATQESDIREQLSSLLKNGTENNISFDDNSLGIISRPVHGAGNTSHILSGRSQNHRGRAKKFPVGQQIH
jgi:hypothetical protein